MLRLIIIPVVIVLIIGFAIYRSLKYYYVCPSCGAHFRLGIFRYMFSKHPQEKHSVTCPKCGKSDILAPKTGKEE